MANGSAWCLFEHKDFGGRELRVRQGEYISNLTFASQNSTIRQLREALLTRLTV